MKENLIIFNTEDILKNFCNSNNNYFYKKLENSFLLEKKKMGRYGGISSFILPNSIKIKPSTIGLIIGEGYLKNIFVIASCSKEIIDNMLEFLSQFNIDLKFYIEIASKNINYSFVNKSRSFWKGITKRYIEKVRLRNNFNNTTEHGTLHICYYNVTFSKLLKFIVIKSLNIIEKSNQFIIDYLKGILAGEGNVNVKKKTNCVYMIRISATKELDRSRYKELLEKIGIKITCKDMPTISKEEGKKLGWKTDKGRAGAVIISRWENFLKILTIDLLELNKDKQDKFIKYFVNNKFTKQFLDFQYFIDKKFTMKDAQVAFNLRARYVNRLKTLERLGYLNKEFIRKFGNNNMYLYILNKKYLEVYNKLNNLNRLDGSPSSKSNF